MNPIIIGGQKRKVYLNGAKRRVFINGVEYGGDDDTPPPLTPDAWTHVNLPGDWYGITYGNGLFVALGYDSSSCATSPDGINWTVYDDALPVSTLWTGVTYANGLFVAVGYTIIFNGNPRRSNSYIATSPDGVNWTLRYSSLNSSIRTSMVEYGNGVFVAMGGYSQKAIVSTDGINWTAEGSHYANYYGLAHGNGVFVVVSYNEAHTDISADGINWTTGNIAQNTWSAIGYGNGLFVILASNKNVAYKSTDGLAWTSLPSVNLPSAGWSDIAFGGGWFVAVSTNTSTIAFISTDGNSWQSKPFSIAAYWRVIAYGNNRFVVTSDGGFAVLMLE